MGNTCYNNNTTKDEILNMNNDMLVDPNLQKEFDNTSSTEDSESSQPEIDDEDLSADYPPKWLASQIATSEHLQWGRWNLLNTLSLQDDAELQQKLLNLDQKKIFRYCKDKANPITSRAIYRGDFEDGKRHGFGELYFQDGVYYLGHFENDLPHGLGAFIKPNGVWYKGEWIAGHCIGQGKYLNDEGTLYEGPFIDDMKSGYASEVYSDGGTYEGHFSLNKRNGTGTLNFNNGASYSGEFKDNKIHGKGEYQYSDGSVYVGKFVDGKMNDQFGEFSWEDDGSVYRGAFVDDHKQGYGELTWASGKVYKGNWWYGKQHGNAYLYDPSTGKTHDTIWNMGKCVVGGHEVF